MEDSENSTPEGADETGSIKPGQSSGHADASNSDSEQPEKVYDFYHQHFGVALAAGSQEVRNAEANGRAAYAASRTEVADKPAAKSESWNALKSLIRYQTAATPARSVDDTSSGDSFEAQWFGKSSEGSGQGEPQEQEAVRLKWIPIVDNVPEPVRTLDESSETAHSAEDTQEAIAQDAPETIDQDAPEANVIEPDAVVQEVIEASEIESEMHDSTDTESGADSTSILDEIDDLLEEDSGEHEAAAEARSKFGSMNAFARLQKRTKEQVETKEEQSITGDIPEEVQSEAASGNWDTKPAPDSAKSEGATVMNQWCSTSTGDSHPAIEDSTPLISLDELNSIPTPSVMKDAASQHKPFSLSTPKDSTIPEPTQPSPDSVHQAARASWLKAASEYSSSVIKAVTEQMKMLSAKPKKTTPESPEFNTAEPSSDDEQDEDSHPPPQS